MWLSVLLLVLFGLGCWITFLAVRRCREGRFYSDTFYLWPLGIYVWGDGLVLGPLWTIMAVIFWLLSPIHILSFVLIFWAARSFFEVIYWLLHQFHGKKYQAPLLKNISWLDPEQAAIIFQLLNFVQFCGAVFGWNLLFGGK